MTDESTSQVGDWVKKNRQAVIIGAAVVVVAVVAIISFSVGGGKSSSSSTTQASQQGQSVDQTSTPLNADGLRAVVKKLGKPIYWAGEVAGFTYILVTKGGTAIVKYLPQGADLTVANANLQIGSYPVVNAFDVTKASSQDPGSKTETNTNGSIVVWNESRPSNIYVAFPKTNVQIELFDPDPAMALQWATSGKVVPIA